ncbi:MAG: DUF6691 family protein [Verrucomicrobiales bacterium]
MNLPIPTNSAGGLLIAAILGLIFGILLNKGRVTDYNVIVNLFRLKDFTVVKIMMTAIFVGGIGVFAMMGMGLLEGYHIKDANLLGVVLGSAIFGVGMALYGYCPGTAVGAIATGRLHALIGFFGMIAGGMAYALSFSWVKANILGVWSYGKIRLPELTGIPAIAWWILIAAGTGALFYVIERAARSHRTRLQ